MSPPSEGALGQTRDPWAESSALLCSISTSPPTPSPRRCAAPGALGTASVPPPPPISSPRAPHSSRRGPRVLPLQGPAPTRSPPGPEGVPAAPSPRGTIPGEGHSPALPPPPAPVRRGRFTFIRNSR